MKKTAIGFLAASAVLGLGAAARRVSQKMRRHCEQMTGQFMPRGESVGKR
jgi:hypothetical protein